MKVLVSDSSLLIELSKRDLLTEMFHLPFKFVVPDLLFEEELIDLGKYSRDDLVRFGLRVETLDPDDVIIALSFQSKYRRLSLVDCFALVLSSSKRYTLLTGDQSMRTVAEADGIEVHGILWIIDHMISRKIVHSESILATLKEMLADPRCHVPDLELTKRIQILSIARHSRNQNENKCVSFFDSVS